MKEILTNYDNHRIELNRVDGGKKSKKNRKYKKINLTKRKKINKTKNEI